jgi:hypothetical protein
MALAPRWCGEEYPPGLCNGQAKAASCHPRHAAVAAAQSRLRARRRAAAAAPRAALESECVARESDPSRHPPQPLQSPAMAKREAPEVETSMSVEELRTLLERARQQSKDNSGKVMMCSDRGPVGFDLVQHLITVVEQQQREIDDLKGKFIN